MQATSVVSWALLWAAYPGVSGAPGHNFFGSGFMSAAQPWSGHYELFPHVWIMAHWGQFTQPGWRYLRVGDDGGSGFLAGGGSFVTLVPPDGGGAHPRGTFTLIVETLTGSCGTQGSCNVPPMGARQNLSFHLRSSLADTPSVRLWCSDSGAQFVQRGSVAVTAGVLRLVMDPDTICTATTLSDGTKGQHPPPPPAAPFPRRHADNFSAAAEDALAWGFADMYGSFAARAGALTQVATAVPTGWAPVNYDPLTMIGDAEWRAVHVSVHALVNHTAPSHYVRVCGGCGDTSSHHIQFGCDAACCFNVSWSGNWSVGPTRGRVARFVDTWHALDLRIAANGSLTAAVDGATVAHVSGACPARAGFGMVGLGCGAYHTCAFDDFVVEATAD